MAGETAQIHINPLVLSDTFNTWFDRTNELIYSINQNVVWDVAGLTSVQIISGITGGNYNGVKSIGIALGAGITHTASGIGMDILGLPTGLTTGTTGTAAQWGGIDPLDYIPIYDQGTSSVRKLEARYAVPYILTPTKTTDTSPNVNNSAGRKLWIEGDLAVAGTLTVLGPRSVISSQNIAMEDKNIELAYAQSAFIGITGVSSATYLQRFDILGVGVTGPVGVTAYYWAAGVTTFTANTATVIARVRSITGAYVTTAAGTTGRIEIGSVYIKGDPTNLQTGGILKIGDVGAAGMTSLVTNEQGITNNFMSNADLDGAGLTIKGASGDKLWVWSNSQNVWEGENIGVFSSGYVYTSKFRNDVGLTTTNTSWNRFVFQGSSGTAAKTTVVLASDGEGEWNISKGKTGVGVTGEALQFLFLTGAGQSTSLIAAEFTPYTSGPLGITSTAGGSASSWAKYLNADFLDGAGGSTASAGNSIPISDNRGRINADWLEASANRQLITQTTHGLTTGMVVRYVTGAFTGYTHASWADSTLSKSVGVVESIPNANSFVVTSAGYVRSLPGAWLANTLYYLGTTGGLTTTYPPLNTYFKPVFNCTTTAGEGYIINDASSLQMTGQTDMVYLRGLIPVGTIQAYAGTEAGLPSYDTDRRSWVFCDGRALSLTGYSDLYNVIGHSYYARGVVTSTTSSALTVSIDGGTRGLAIGNLINVGVDLGTGTPAYLTSGTVGTISGSTITIPEIITTGNFAQNVFVVIQGRTDNSNTQSIFFVPDFRSRIPVGASGPQYFAGRISNTLVPGTTSYAGGLGIGYTGSTTGGSIATNWIIRAQQTLDAVVLTGHNHNTSYVRHDISTQYETSGAIPSAGATARYNARTNIAAVSTETNNTVTGTLAMSNTTSSTSITSGALTVAGGVGISGALYVARASSFSAGLSAWSTYVSTNSTIVGALSVSGSSNLTGLTATSLDVSGTSRFAGDVTFNRQTTHGATAIFTTINADNIVASTSIRIGAVAGGGSSIVVAGVSTLEGITASYLNISQGITTSTLYVKNSSTLENTVAQSMLVQRGLTVSGTFSASGYSTIQGLSAANIIVSAGLTSELSYAKTVKGGTFSAENSLLVGTDALSKGVLVQTLGSERHQMKTTLVSGSTRTKSFKDINESSATVYNNVLRYLDNSSPTQSKGPCVITLPVGKSGTDISGGSPQYNMFLTITLRGNNLSSAGGAVNTKSWVCTIYGHLNTVSPDSVGYNSPYWVSSSVHSQGDLPFTSIQTGFISDGASAGNGTSTPDNHGRRNAVIILGNNTQSISYPNWIIDRVDTSYGTFEDVSKFEMQFLPTLFGTSNAITSVALTDPDANGVVRSILPCSLTTIIPTIFTNKNGDVGLGVASDPQAQLDVLGTIIGRQSLYAINGVKTTSIVMGPPTHGTTGGTASSDWSMAAQNGMISHGLFSSGGLTSLGGFGGITAISIGAATMGNPEGVYTYDMGTGIEIKSGTVVTLESGYNWKII